MAATESLRHSLRTTSAAKTWDQIYGSMVVPWAFAAAFGPQLFAYLRQIGGDYDEGLRLISGMLAISMVIPVLVSPPRNRKSVNEQPGKDILEASRPLPADMSWYMLSGGSEPKRESGSHSKNKTAEMQIQRRQTELPNNAIRRMAIQSGILAMAIVALWAGPAHAQAAANHPDMSGFWELRFDSFNIPHASLTPQAATANMADQEEHDRLSIRWCDQLGVPALMAERQPLDIRQGPKEMAIVVHPPSSVRYIYTDGRMHPNKDDYDPTTNGNSIGHWEGDTLVVDTIYFNDRGVTRLPGGGIRTADSHLTEHFRLLNNGSNLLVTFTWEDPKVFAKPHTYAYMYSKVAAPGMPRIYTCTAGDSARAKFLTTDPQPGTSWPTN